MRMLSKSGLKKMLLLGMAVPTAGWETSLSIEATFQIKKNQHLYDINGFLVGWFQQRKLPDVQFIAHFTYGEEKPCSLRRACCWNCRKEREKSFDVCRIIIIFLKISAGFQEKGFLRALNLSVTLEGVWPGVERMGWEGSGAAEWAKGISENIFPPLRWTHNSEGSADERLTVIPLRVQASPTRAQSQQMS